MTNETDWVYLEQQHKARLEMGDIAAVGMMGWEVALEENKRLAARVAELEAQVPPAKVVEQLRRFVREQSGWAEWEALTAWLATLPTQDDAAYIVGARVKIIGHTSKLAGYRDNRNPIGETGRVVYVLQPWGTDDDPGYTVETDSGERYALMASEIEAQP